MSAEREYVKGQIVEVVPSSLRNGLGEVVSVGKKNLFLRPIDTSNVLETHWTIAYPNKRGTALNDDIYSVPKFHCRPHLNPTFKGAK